MKKRIDSLVDAQKDSLYLALDKQCEKRYDIMFDHAFDSIKNKRLEEIDQIFNQ